MLLWNAKGLVELTSGSLLTLKLMKIVGRITTFGCFHAFYAQCSRKCWVFGGLDRRAFVRRLWITKLSQFSLNFPLNSLKNLFHSQIFLNFTLIFSRESHFVYQQPPRAAGHVIFSVWQQLFSVRKKNSRMSWKKILARWT